jgi:hypothetical protein
MKKLFILSLVSLMLSGCADVAHVAHSLQPDNQLGFLYGLYHGVIAPVAFFVSLFDDSVAIYAVNNSGSWYNLGYLFGIGAYTSLKLNKS